MINDLKTSGEWKINLTLKINYMSSKDSYEKWLLHSKSDNLKTIIDENRQPIGIEESMKGNELAFD